MARKRSNHFQRSRKSPGSDRPYYEYLVSTPAPMISRQDILRLLRGGEDTYLELKVRFSNVEKLIAEIIALANTSGGAVVFGVTDQLRIEGVDDLEEIEEKLRELCSTRIQPPVFPYIRKVAFDNGRRIVILEVDSENRPHRNLEDRFYIREGAIKREATREEISRIYGETWLTRFEQVPVFKSRIETDIDESLFWSYIRSVNPGHWGESARGFPTGAVMLDMGLAVRLGGEIIPTVGGLLLFGLSDRLSRLIPRAELVLTRYSGTDQQAPEIERAVVHGNLLRLFDGAMGFINRYVDLWDARPSKRALETSSQNLISATEASGEDPFLNGRANYHRQVVIEALTNSIVHRDWSVSSPEARINIYDDSIEFINPSGIMELPGSSLRYGVAIPHNPRLKAIFTNLHYGIPSAYGGVPMIFEETVNFARQAPHGPSLVNGEFRLKIPGLK